MHLREIDANLLVILDALLVDASVTRAGERLGRSASAISHALAKLREIFGDELLVRAGQKLVPTAKALEIAPTVHVILAGMESLLRPSKPFDPTDTDRDFAIAATEVGELMLVQPLRQRLQQVAPSVRVGWVPGTPEETVAALRQGRCHFAIGIGRSGGQAPDIRVSTLYDDALTTLARPGHAFVAKSPDVTAFAAGNHVALHALPVMDLISRQLAKSRQGCNVSAHVSSVLAGVLLILDSDALLTVPRSLATRLEAKFGLTRVAAPLEEVRVPVQLLWHSSYDRDECHNWVREEIAVVSAEASGQV